MPILLNFIAPAIQPVQLGSKPVHFKVYCPAANPLDPPTCREHTWPVFANAVSSNTAFFHLFISACDQPFDRETAEQMIETQVKDQGGIPLHCQPNARNLDPKIKPGPNQSFVAVTTKVEFEAKSAQEQHNIHANRCVLILDTGNEPPPPFNRETLERYRDVDADCEIQGASCGSFLSICLKGDRPRSAHEKKRGYCANWQTI